MILVTGATGFLGQQLLGRLLIDYPEEKLAILIRPIKTHDAYARGTKMLQSLLGTSHIEPILDRVQVIQGDLSLSSLGLSTAEAIAIGSKLTKVFHCAAAVSFDQALEDARRSNVEGTLHLLHFMEFAGSISKKKIELHYISTAFVVGDTERTVCPSELDVDSCFKNNYEKSKAEAEAIVRQYTDKFATTIYRPSIIVGDSVTGQTSTFNVIYAPARFFVRGIVKAIPGCPNTLFDIIPVDYVADAVSAISKQQHSSGSCFHICSGVGKEATLGELIESLYKAFERYCNRSLTAPPFLPPEILQLAMQSINVAIEGVKTVEKFLGSRIELFSKILPYLIYMVRNPRFDTSATQHALMGILPPPPPTQQYCEKLFDYCFETDWGKNPWTNPRNLQSWIDRQGPIYYHSR